VLSLFLFLSRRRALTEPPEREDISYVVTSVMKTSDEIVETRRALKENSGADRAVRALQEACLDFLSRVDGRDAWGYDPAFVRALGQLHGQFSIFLRELASVYKINVDPRLRGLLWPSFTRSAAVTDNADDGEKQQ